MKRLLGGAGEMKERLGRLAAALDAEVQYIKQDSTNQTFELSSGERDPNSKGFGGVYSFLLADSALRLPEDAAGTLRIGGQDARAFVVAHEGNRIWLLLEASEELQSFIPNATLSLCETDLLERLKERMTDLADTRDWGMADKVFGYDDAETGVAPLPSHVAERVGDGGMRMALEQALGSQVTFLWGPPGTGKTFSIAATVASLVEVGETVLVTSHTHAAVEQALWAAIEPASADRLPGLLARSEHVEDGKVLKVGPVRDGKIPPECHLDSRLEIDALKRQEKLAEILQQLNPLQAELNDSRKQLQHWTAFEAAEAQLASARAEHSKTQVALDRALVAVEGSKAAVAESRAALERAEHSFPIGRKGRIDRARQALQASAPRIVEAEVAAAHLTAELAKRDERVFNVEEIHSRASTAVQGLPSRTELQGQAGRLSEGIEMLDQKAEALRGPNNDLANELLDRSRALFLTLTKLYMDPNLRSREWDTVIIDEASMAMPPLVAWAASRARHRVVICGDFFQLPPVVHSNDGLAAEELGQSLFDIRGIPDAVKAGDGHPQLAKLMIQRRMHPQIAEVARTLVYGRDLADHPDVGLRVPPSSIGVLEVPTSDGNGGAPGAPNSGSPLVVVDLAPLHAWSGKVKGSLSRFNFYSAQAALEIAALYAARTPKPDKAQARPIGVITPYAAQRRYLTKLLEAFGDLADWVTVGTVHTFQGNECDVIIFDSVLGEPHWTARLVNPHQTASVVKDLNVAVTRARHQFIFLADTKWFNAHAKPGSGFGALWGHLKNTAPIIDVRSILGEDLQGRIAASDLKAVGWGTADAPAAVTLHDETSFYPAFLADLAAAREQVVLYTPYIGKTRWPKVAAHITDLAARGVEVILLHKPLSDPAWKEGDPVWGKKVFTSLADAGVKLVPISGVHAKTILIDGRLVYEGSLNWASQTQSYEHMLRIESRDVALLVERMMQLRDLLSGFRIPNAPEATCPNCGGPLIVINQTSQGVKGDSQPLKLACLNYQLKKAACKGHLRGVDQRAPFLKPPNCPKGSPMTIKWSSSGKPWSWSCPHKGCQWPRWRFGDVIVGKPPKESAA